MLGSTYQLMQFFFWKSWHIFLSSYWLIFMSASSPFWQPSCCVCLSTCVCVSFRMARWLESTLLKWQQEFPSLYRQTASAAFSQSHRLNTRKRVTFFFVKFIILLSKISNIFKWLFSPQYMSLIFINYYSDWLLLWQKRESRKEKWTNHSLMQVRDKMFLCKYYNYFHICQNMAKHAVKSVDSKWIDL